MPHRPTLNVVVGCTSRKRQPVPRELRLRSVRALSPGERANRWIERLDTFSTAPVPNNLLYSGGHWSVVSHLIEEAAESGIDLNLWVFSAGYGLVRFGAALKPYSATFASGHADAVPRAPFDWWSRLTEWRGPEPGAARSLASLAKTSRASLLLLVLSAPYLRACLPDALAAAEIVTDPDRFAIISAGTKPSGQLASHFLPADGRFQQALGGTLQGLNARIARLVVRSDPTTQGFKEIRISLAQQLVALPSSVTHDRKRLSDEDVCAFIADELVVSPLASKSNLLRKLRESGRACEQERFGSLFAGMTA